MGDERDSHDWRPRRHPGDEPGDGTRAPERLDATGESGPTRGQSRSSRWRRSVHGFYVPAETPSSVDQRIVEVAVAAGAGITGAPAEESRPRASGPLAPTPDRETAGAPAHAAAVTGWAAARWHGAALFDGLERDGRTEVPVPVLRRGSTRAPRGGVLIRSTLRDEEVVTRSGLGLVLAERAVVDEVLRRRDFVEGVVTVDMACAGEITSLTRLADYLRSGPRRRGLGLVWRCLHAASEHSHSPPETRMRLVWQDRPELPAPLANVPVYDPEGPLIGIPDLFDPEAGVAAEYQGAHHRSRARHRSDTTRAELFAEHGIEVFEVVAGDSVAVILRRLLAAYARARGRPASARTWTLTPPRGAWVPPYRLLSLDERIAARERGALP